MIKPIVIALAAGIVILGGIYLVLDSRKPAGVAQVADGGTEAGSGEFMKNFITFFSSSCVSSAKAALAEKGVDASAGQTATKIDTYCGCAVERIQSDISVPEIMAFKVNPSSEPAASKMKNIVKACGDKIGNFAQ